MTHRGQEEDPVFRSLAAPGLDEDDLFVAMQGLPVPSLLWGDGWPAPHASGERPWCEEEQRRRRHEELLRKWGGDGPTSPPTGRSARGARGRPA